MSQLDGKNANVSSGRAASSLFANVLCVGPVCEQMMDQGTLWCVAACARAILQNVELVQRVEDPRSQAHDNVVVYAPDHESYARGCEHQLAVDRPAVCNTREYLQLPQ